MDTNVRKTAWTNFVINNIIITSVNHHVSDSWIRCKELGVDYNDGIGKNVSGELLKNTIYENEELIKIARPIMENLHTIVKGSGFIIVLSDRNGCIIEVFGDKTIEDSADTINFNLGCIWTEEAVGTNAIGTAMFIDKPIQIIGEEHYCMPHHKWTCSATTIHDEKGNIIGCLNMSGKKEAAHPHTLGIVVAAVYTIEKQRELLRSYELINTTFDGTSDGIIIIDINYNISKFNNSATEILEIEPRELYKINIKEMLKDVDIEFQALTIKEMKSYLDFNFYMGNKTIRCSVNMVPRMLGNKVIGVAITFRKIEYLHKTINKVTGNKALYTFDSIITKNNKMLDVIEAAKKMAKTKCSILIEGESGTGKELFAQATHNYSSFSEGPFVAINCASLPKDLLESELFGYEKGAFTGASKEGNPGKFELAQGGTIFLDEIGELPLEVQSKLLRVLDNYKVRRIGGKSEIKLNLRVLAATNRNLFEEVKNKNFRQDLYYRLNVLKIDILPLRERREDIELIANYFLSKLKKYQNKNGADKFSPKFINYLNEYNWNGNVRELQNIIERAYYLCDESIITEKYLYGNIIKQDTMNLEVVSLDNAEKGNIIKMIIECSGNVVEAGGKLNLSKSTIYRKIKKHNINLDLIF